MFDDLPNYIRSWLNDQPGSYEYYLAMYQRLPIKDTELDFFKQIYDSRAGTSPLNLPPRL